MVQELETRPVADAAPPPKGPRRAALVFILVTIVLDMLALGIVIPVLPRLVLAFLGGDMARAARVVGLFSTVWALMQFVFSPLLGAVSDRFGRRKVILTSNLGLGLDYILMALAPGIGLLFVGRIVSGITAASISTAGAYIADVLPPEKRAGGFGMLSAAFGIGFVLGPALGGLLGQVDPRLPFWVAASLSLTNACYGFFVLPESLPPEKRGQFSWRRANPVGSLKLLRSHPQLFGLASVNFLSQIAHQSLPSMFVLYSAYRYHWNASETGLSLALVGACSIVVGGFIVRPAVARFGERRCLTAGLVFGALGFASLGAAGTVWGFLVGTVLLGLWGLAQPALQGLMTRHVKPSEQGQLQGASTSLQAISGLFGPSVFTLSFAAAIAAQGVWHIPGTPYFIAALLLAAAAVLARWVTRPAAL